MGVPDLDGLVYLAIVGLVASVVLALATAAGLLYVFYLGVSALLA